MSFFVVTFFFVANNQMSIELNSIRLIENLCNFRFLDITKEKKILIFEGTIKNSFQMNI